MLAMLSRYTASQSGGAIPSTTPRRSGRGEGSVTSTHTRRVTRSAVQRDRDGGDVSCEGAVGGGGEVRDRHRALEAVGDHPVGVDEVDPGVGAETECGEPGVVLGALVGTGGEVVLDVLDEQPVPVGLRELLEDLHGGPAGARLAEPGLPEVADHRSA